VAMKFLFSTDISFPPGATVLAIVVNLDFDAGFFKRFRFGER